MSDLDLYNAIFHRKSIRKYKMTSLDISTINEIKSYVEKIKPLEETIKIDFSYLSTEDVKNLLPIRAPHYICMYSDKADGYLMNAGFVLQQIDLYLSAKGIGSCWLGMAKPAKGVPNQKNGMEFVIMIAFGNSQEPIHRTDITAFKRKDIAQISSVEGLDNDIINAVRFAPSATNSQPWFLTGNSKEIQINRVKLSLIKAPLYDKMNQIDIGIALYHLYLAVKIKGGDIKFRYDTNSNNTSPKGYQYMLSSKLEF